MGFDSIVASILTLALIVAVIYVFVSGSLSLIDLSISEYKKEAHKFIEILNTKINITNIVYDNTINEVIADIENIGETRFSDFSYFDVFLYGNASGYTGTYYPSIAEVDTYLTNEITNPGIFDPYEVARFEISLNNSLPNGTYVLVICAPNGVCCSGKFVVGG